MLRTEGIVLKEMRFKDTDKILNIYTRRYGKISAMVKGAYKPKSQFISSTQPFSYNEYQLQRGKSFYYLQQADILDSFYSIRENMDRVIYGYYILELADKSIPDEEENEKLFLLIEKGIRILSEMDKQYLNFIVAYELKFISFLGYKPYIDKCVICNNQDLNKIKFSIKEGGIICERCFGVDSMARFLTKEMYETMYRLLYIPLENTSDIIVSYDAIYRLHQILVEYILESIDRKRFNSLNLMDSLDESNGL